MGQKVETRNVDTQESTLWHKFEDGWECYGKQSNKKRRKEFFEDKSEALESEKRTAFMNEQQALIEERDAEGDLESRFWVTEAMNHKRTERTTIKKSEDEQ